WRPSRAPGFGPVPALSPLSRALFTEAMRHAGGLEPIAPPVWTLPWTVHRQAHHPGPPCPSPPPDVLPGAIAPHRPGSPPGPPAPDVLQAPIAHQRLRSRTGRPVPCTSRTVGRARLRTAPLDGLAWLRRCLPPVVPEGCMPGRPCGVLQARWAIAPAPLPRVG